MTTLLAFLIGAALGFLAGWGYTAVELGSGVEVHKKAERAPTGTTEPHRASQKATTIHLPSRADEAREAIIARNDMAGRPTELSELE